jgi:hypothetical protein
VRNEGEIAHGPQIERPDGSFFRAESGLDDSLMHVRRIPTLENGQYLEVGEEILLAYLVRFETPARRKVKDTRVVLFAPGEMQIAEFSPNGPRVQPAVSEGSGKKAIRVPVNSERKIVTAGRFIFDMQRRHVAKDRKDLSLVLGSIQPDLSAQVRTFTSLRGLAREVLGIPSKGVVFEA